MNENELSDVIDNLPYAVEVINAVCNVIDVYSLLIHVKLWK